MHISKRDTISLSKAWSIRAIAILLALIVDGIIIYAIVKMNPFVMILISALLSFLDKGAVQIASDFGLNEYVSKIISGVILFFILGSEFFINYQVKAGGKHK